jgi:hypothetical protein
MEQSDHDYLVSLLKGGHLSTSAEELLDEV